MKTESFLHKRSHDLDNRLSACTNKFLIGD